MVPARPPPTSGRGHAVLAIALVLAMFLALGMLQAWTGAPLLFVGHVFRVLVLFHH